MVLGFYDFRLHESLDNIIHSMDLDSMDWKRQGGWVTGDEPVKVLMGGVHEKCTVEMQTLSSNILTSYR